MDPTKCLTEIHTGIGGNGEPIWLVVTVRENDGSWRHIERFNTEAEAISWRKWA